MFILLKDTLYVFKISWLLKSLRCDNMKSNNHVKKISNSLYVHLMNLCCPNLSDYTTKLLNYELKCLSLILWFPDLVTKIPAVSLFGSPILGLKHSNKFILYHTEINKWKNYLYWGRFNPTNSVNSDHCLKSIAIKHHMKEKKIDSIMVHTLFTTYVFECSIYAVTQAHKYMQTNI